MNEEFHYKVEDAVVNPTYEAVQRRVNWVVSQTIDGAVRAEVVRVVVGNDIRDAVREGVNDALRWLK